MNPFWTRYLSVSIVVLFAMGLAFAFAPLIPAFAGPLDALDTFLLGAPAVDPVFRNFTYGVIGAVTAGWAVTVWFVGRNALVRGERWAWFAVAESVGLWFVLDVAASLAAGAWVNAAMNTVFLLVLLAPPLIALRPGAPGGVTASATRAA